jgi:hypothetical protein
MKLFHISEEPDIKIFHPRPSPQFYQSIKDDVVFAISDKLLHNYLLPRNCPRVTYYKGVYTPQEDMNKFFGKSTADYIINVEETWKERIRNVTLYKYEFAQDNFTLLDENAGYYVSSKSEVPVSVTEITDVIGEIEKRNVELRFLPEIKSLAKEVAVSGLKFSIIRMPK